MDPSKTMGGWRFSKANGKWERISAEFHPRPEHGVAFFLHSSYCPDCKVDARSAQQMVFDAKPDM
jgi:hypothetical protein